MSENELKRADFRARRHIIYTVIQEMDVRISEFMASNPIRHFWGAVQYAEIEALQNILFKRTSELRSISEWIQRELEITEFSTEFELEFATSENFAIRLETLHCCLRNILAPEFQRRHDLERHARKLAKKARTPVDKSTQTVISGEIKEESTEATTTTEQESPVVTPTAPKTVQVG
jgi:hypothetical protein